jgi:tetraprenyl-beta-curcumene synthase
MRVTRQRGENRLAPLAPVLAPLAPALTFAGAARRYWLGVFPCARGELRHWRLRAEEILDPALRRLACQAQCSKRESLEGAIAFATFAPHAHRALVTRAITAYQVAFDYIDELSEQPGADPIANGRRLNQALLCALEPSDASHLGATHLDYYAHDKERRGDTGYLRDLVDTCRTALEALPSYVAIGDSVRRVTARLVAYQSLNHGDGNGSYEAFAQWARAETRRGRAWGLRWWETGAAAGSPLPVFALMAAAARPSTRAKDATDVERAYFPWIASLSSLLDSLIDRHEDEADGQRSLIDYYGSTNELATRLQALATQAVGATRALADGNQHTLILAAMASFYRATPQASLAPDTRLVTQRVLDAMVGDFVLPTTLILRARRWIGCVFDAAAALRNKPRVAIRHANSGIGAFVGQVALAVSTRATTSVRDVSRIPALERRRRTPRRLTGEVGERASKPRA